MKNRKGYEAYIQLFAAKSHPDKSFPVHLKQVLNHVGYFMMWKSWNLLLADFTLRIMHNTYFLFHKLHHRCYF